MPIHECIIGDVRVDHKEARQVSLMPQASCMDITRPPIPPKSSESIPHPPHPDFFEPPTCYTVKSNEMLCKDMLVATGFVVSNWESTWGCPWMNASGSIVHSKRTNFKPYPRTWIRIDPSKSVRITREVSSKIKRNKIFDFH